MPIFDSVVELGVGICREVSLSVRIARVLASRGLFPLDDVCRKRLPSTLDRDAVLDMLLSAELAGRLGLSLDLGRQGSVGSELLRVGGIAAEAADGGSVLDERRTSGYSTRLVPCMMPVPANCGCVTVCDDSGGRSITNDSDNSLPSRPVQSC